MKNKKENQDIKALQKVTNPNIQNEKPTFAEKFSLKFRKGFITNKFRTWILIIILITSFIALNIWASSKDLARIDVTENKLYSLTQTSKSQLENLNKDVTIYIYKLDENSQYVNFVKQYAAFNNHIKYELVSSETHYDIITKYQLSSYGYSAMVVVCEDKDITLYPDYQFITSDYINGAYEDIDLTEETITNAILNVSTDDPIKVYLATGHGEYTINNLTLLTSILEAQVYECDTLNLLSATSIPDDCDILTILSPESDITESEVNVLKEYISRGGNIFFAMRKKDSSTSYTNWQKVLDLYGVSIEYGVLVEGNLSNCMSSNGISYRAILMPNSSTESAISSEISNSGYTTVIPWAQRLVINSVKEDNVQVSNEELLYTSDKCYAVSDMSNGFNTDGIDPKKHTIAAKFTRTMTIPAEEGKESTSKTSNIIVIGNASFLADNDEDLPSPIKYGANSNFAANCFADLAEQENLITVKKASHYSTFISTTTDDLIVKTIIFAVPIILILIGIIIWNVRRRKR